MKYLNQSTIKGLIGLSNAVSDDQTRFHLSCIEISRKLDTKTSEVCATATDGHMMARITFQDEHLYEAVGSFRALYLEKQDVDQLKLELKHAPNYGVVLFRNELKLKDDSNCGFKYPSTTQFIPKFTTTVLEEGTDVQHHSIGLDINLLVRVQKVFKSVGSKKALGSLFEMKNNDRLSPILLTHKNLTDGVSECIAVVMPMRI